MELSGHIAEVQRHLAAAAAAGGDQARELAERLTAPLDAALRLTLLDALSAAAGEITRELAPGSVELRLRRGDPDFVVSLPPAEPLDDPAAAGRAGPWNGDAAPASSGVDDGGVSRINLRLPDHVKDRVERAADREGLSINTWLVRAAAAALDRGTTEFPRPGPPRRQEHRYTGWVR